MTTPNISAAMDDLKMEDAVHQPQFSVEEKEILDLYDQAQKLELEAALMKARVRLAKQQAEDAGKTASHQAEPNPESHRESREQLAEAMALYRVRNTVVNNILTTNPILKGIHNSTYASPIEQDLPAWIQTRDETSHAVASQSATLRQVLDQLTETESETARAVRRNRDLAAEVLRLAKEADCNREGALADDPEAKDQIEKLEERLAASRQRWRVIKGTASGIVAGSGVDWVSDAVLRDVVLYPE